MTRFTGEYVADRKDVHNAVRASVGNRCIRCGHPEGDRMWRTRDPNFVGEMETGNHGIPGRIIVRDRDVGEWLVFVLKDCTEHCSHPQDDKLRILTVHHLTGKKGDNRWWNLLPLCQVCHLQIQGKVIPEVPYLWPHSEWFKPYVCGFYAAFYGNRDITREEAMADPDRWLKLGQPWLYEATP